MEDIVDYALVNEEDALPILKFFRTEEKTLQRRIKNSPLSAGIDFPPPVKKGTSHSGKYIILYTCAPLSAVANNMVKKVNLDVILPAASANYNVMSQLATFNLEEQLTSMKPKNLNTLYANNIKT